MTIQTQTLGEQLIALLEQYNVSTVFGIPGVHTIELYRSLASSSIKHITPRHEQGAGFMADGYARASGEVGVCLCITGPGMTNITTPMAQAFADSIPMLVISSVNRTKTLGLGSGRLHELKDQQALVNGVAAFSHTLTNPNELPALFAKAFHVFRSERPRPVHIEIPTDLMTQAVNVQLPPKPDQKPKPAPADSTVNLIVDKISKAEQVALLIGGGCINAQRSLNTFVDLVAAPTCLTINARGLLSTDHPLLLNGVQTVDAFRDYIAQCDLCIAIGTELGETDYDFYDKGPLEPAGEFIRIDIDEHQLNTNVEATLAVHSDADLALTALCSAIKDSKSFNAQQNAELMVTKLNAALADTFTAADSRFNGLLKAINNAQPNAIIVGDSTQPIYFGNFVHQAPAPRHWFNSATGYGTLGYAMPAAIGAKLSKPNKPVIAIVGDGSFQFTLNELIVATQEHVGIAIIVWNNNAYQEIKDFMRKGDITPVGVDILGPELSLLAQSMEADYALAKNMDAISAALTALDTRDKPIVIEYKVIS